MLPRRKNGLSLGMPSSGEGGEEAERARKPYGGEEEERNEGTNRLQRWGSMEGREGRERGGKVAFDRTASCFE